MNKQYIIDLCTEYGLISTYMDNEFLIFTLRDQVSDSVQLTIDRSNTYRVEVRGQDLSNTIKEHTFDDIQDAIKALSVFNDYYSMVVLENFKQF